MKFAQVEGTLLLGLLALNFILDVPQEDKTTPLVFHSIEYRSQDSLLNRLRDSNTNETNTTYHEEENIVKNTVY